jgi:PTH1 family peptidyl-tRNA hydrolase
MIIVGLGNPGTDYAGTRHNIGFAILDTLLARLGGEWKEDRGVLYATVQGHWLLKPQKYMNRSGQALREFFSWHNLPNDPAALHAHLIVVHDDLDFPVGTMREQRDRSSAGHNGVQSIIDAFSTKDFTRFRVGIGQPATAVIPIEDFVLQRFLPEEREQLEGVTEDIVRMLEERITK